MRTQMSLSILMCPLSLRDLGVSMKQPMTLRSSSEIYKLPPACVRDSGCSSSLPTHQNSPEHRGVQRELQLLRCALSDVFAPSTALFMNCLRAVRTGADFQS